MRCGYCGKEFEPRRKDQRYCSKSCKVMASRRRSKRGSKTSKKVNSSPGLSKLCLNDSTHTTIPPKGKLTFCAGCGREFYARKEGQKYCSRSCAGKAKITKPQKARREALAESKRNLLGIEIPEVYRFVIRNCDYCRKKRKLGEDGCSSPRANILSMKINDLPPEFWQIIKTGECPRAEFKIWDTSCRLYDSGTCARGIKSCDGCAHSPRRLSHSCELASF